ncbi:flagellar motor switch protein FliN, partial [Candidatus Endoriftia persephone str. Guaymas]|nr:flagellar motor switch protein FliN [Candidatus Endoriftia persephone str. Guaymas]
MSDTENSEQGAEVVGDEWAEALEEQSGSEGGANLPAVNGAEDEDDAETVSLDAILDVPVIISMEI